MADAIAIFLCTFAALASFLYVHMYGVNMLYSDQWTDVDLLKRFHDGTLTWSYLWAQHNEHRMVVPKLVVLALGSTTHFNIQFEDYLCVAALCGATALFVLTHRRRSTKVPLLAYCPVVFVLLSPVVVGDALLGFNLAWFLALLAFGGTLFLLDREEVSRSAFVGSVVIAVLASFTCLQGLFIWPALLVLLWLRRRPLVTIAVWAGSAAVTTAVFFIGFNFDLAKAGSSSAPRTAGGVLRFFVVEVGNVLGSQATYGEERFFGTAVLLLAAATLVVGLRRGTSDGAPVGVALITFGLAFLVSATIGRAQLGLGDALRYAPFVLMILVGAYLILLSWLQRVLYPEGGVDGMSTTLPSLGPSGQLWTPVVLFGCAFLLSVYQPVVSNQKGPADSGGWHAEEVSIANVTANIDQAPDYVVQGSLGGYSPAFIRDMTQFAREQRLSLFGTSSADDQTRIGLAPNFMTTVLRPSSGQVLSGRVLLDAGVVARHATDVEFLVTGQGLDQASVAVGSLGRSGYVGRWNTTNVADGTYYLFSQATTAEGTTYTSSPVVITVRNG
ncbi:MAG TPA: hypothetical protein VII96_12135 [Acidimicrobiales bacterium]